MLVNEGLFEVGIKSGVISFLYDKVGCYILYLELCEGGIICVCSEGKLIVIVDIDGGYLVLLLMDYDLNN